MSVRGGTIQLQIGGCGNRLGCQYWLALSEDHNINIGNGLYDGNNKSDVLFADTAFNINKYGQYRPKCILIDNDKLRLDGILSEAGLKSFFCEDTKVLVKADTLCLDRDSAETQISIEPILEVLRKELEINDFPCGLQLVHSASGSFTTKCVNALLPEIKNHYNKKFIMNAVVLPEIEPGGIGGCNFRMIPLFDSLINHSEGCFLYDNGALQLVWQSLRSSENTQLDNLNHLAATHLAGITASHRLPGPMNRSLRNLLNGIIMLTGMHFFIPSISPINCLTEKICCQGNVFDYTRQLFKLENSMLIANRHPSLIRHYSAAGVYRGPVSPFEARRELENLIVKRPEVFPAESGFAFEHAFVSSSGDHGPLTMTAALNSNSCADPIQRIIETCTVNEGKVLARYLEAKDETEKAEFQNQENSLRNIVDLYQKDALSMYESAKSDEGNTKIKLNKVEESDQYLDSDNLEQ
ncbi:hypothetical protein ACOME3_001510 [Neoechinorhynchus agilis]